MLCYRRVFPQFLVITTSNTVQKQSSIVIMLKLHHMPMKIFNSEHQHLATFQSTTMDIYFDRYI